MPSPHLVACVLGGTTRDARTELHDVAFAVGESLEATHEQLLDGWFGDPRGLHVDAWCLLDSVQDDRVRLSRSPAENGLHLYFINIGGYRQGVFVEGHAWGFFGAPDKTSAKGRAKQKLLQDHGQLHKDDLYDIDDCLKIARVGAWHVHLEADPEATDPAVTNGYFPLPKSAIDDWIARRAVRP